MSVNKVKQTLLVIYNKGILSLTFLIHRNAIKTIKTFRTQMYLKFYIEILLIYNLVKNATFLFYLNLPERLHSDKTANALGIIHSENTQLVNYICIFETRRKINKQLYTKANQRNFYHSVIIHSLARTQIFSFHYKILLNLRSVLNFETRHSFGISSLARRVSKFKWK